MKSCFKVRGHEAAELDPLGLHAWRKWTDKAIASVVAVDTSSPQRNERKKVQCLMFSYADMVNKCDIC